jgi:hypothetical protein
MPPEIRSRWWRTIVGPVLDYGVRPYPVQQSSQWVPDDRSFFGPALISNGPEDADQSCSHCGDRPINLAPLQREVSDDERTARIFIWLLTCADGTANKRLVQVTSLRDRFTRKLCQGSWFTLIEEVHVAHRICTVPASDNGVAHQILQRKDSQTAFYYRAV